MIYSRKTLYNCASLAMLLALLATWQWLAKSPSIKFLFGSPSSVFEALQIYTLDGSLLFDMWITGTEAFLGFIIGVGLGTLIGFSLWYSPGLAYIFRPYLFVLGAVPIFAFAPMIIVWFGIGYKMKVAVSALGTFLVALMQAYAGAGSVSVEEYGLFKIWGASRFQILKKVIFPAALSWVFNSMKLNVGVALLGAFIGEFISADHGVGHFMMRAGSLYDIPAVLAGGIYLVLLALIFHGLVRILESQRARIICLCSVSSEVRAAATPYSYA